MSSENTSRQPNKNELIVSAIAKKISFKQPKKELKANLIGKRGPNFFEK